MAPYHKIAVVGASGNFGRPITAALIDAGFAVSIITRQDSTTQHPAGIPIIRTEYTLQHLTEAFTGQDAVVSVVGPAGASLETVFVDAAEAAKVKRLIVSDFGWGLNPDSLPEFNEIGNRRQAGWRHAGARANKNSSFSWTALSTGNPIDMAIYKFPLMGWDVTKRTATIYDDGTRRFTGTTLAGIGQAVVGVLQHPEETANRYVPVMSIMLCQNEIMAAFEEATGEQWTVQHASSKELLASGRAKHQTGTSGWVLELVVAQLYLEHPTRYRVADSWAESNSPLLGVREESVREIVDKVLRMTMSRGRGDAAIRHGDN